MGESKWILIAWLRPSRFSPICFVLFFFNKTPLHERSLLFFTNRELHFTGKQIHEMCMVQGILYVRLCWVCRLINTERSGESPSPSARRLCKTCIFKNESYRKKRGLGKLIRKTVLGNVLPNIFFCLGLAKIVFQLDAVKFAIELILSKQRPKFRLHVLFWVSRLEKQAIGCVAFAKCKGTWYLLVVARKSVFNEINGFNHN